MSKTFFKDVRSKSPINTQARLIIRPANPNLLHTPPPKQEPYFAPNPVQAYCKMLRERIKAIEEANKNRPSKKERRRIQAERESRARKNREIAYRAGWI